MEEKLGQEFDKSNDRTSKDVILPGENHSHEMIELRTSEDNSQEQWNHEPKKETEIEKGRIFYDKLSLKNLQN